MAATSTRMGGGRSPPFIIIGLSIAFCILGFNYWSLSSENATLVEEYKSVSASLSASKSKQVVAEKRSESITAQLEQCKSSASAKDEENKANNAEKDAKIDAAVLGENACKKIVETAESNIVGVQTELQQVKGELSAAQEKVQACLTKECESFRKGIVTNFLDIVEKTLGKETVETLAKAGLTSDNNQPKPDVPAVPAQAAAPNPPVVAQDQPPAADKPGTEDETIDSKEDPPQKPKNNRQLDVKEDDNRIEKMQQSLQREQV